MELFMLLIVLFVVFLSSCIAIIVLNDSDILTFLAVHFGKAPGAFYTGKVTWITGASSGIGEALAKDVVQSSNNLKLVISARREDELERVKKECLALNKNIKESDIYVLPFDMTNMEAHEECVKSVIKKFGKLDVLVSNAGRSQRALWHKIDLQVDRDLFELNVFSLINLNRIVVRYFMESGGGQLAVTSSTAGRIGVPYSGSYTGSKHALHGYFDALRNEVRQNNIQVVLLCPGPTFSSLLGQCFTEEAGKKFEQDMQETDRRMTAERCAFLSSVAMANGIEESWMGLFPIIPLLYLRAYLPYLSEKLTALMGRSGYFLKIRDSRQTVKHD